MGKIKLLKNIIKPVDKSGIMSYTNQAAQMEQISKAEKLEKHEKTY